MSIENEARNAADQFMLEEYKTIAAAHFDLHAGLRQIFRFYLGIVALPFTVLAVVFRDQELTLTELPDILLAVFALIAVVGLMLFINMINTRFDIILYTRTVNGVRAYFKDRAKDETRPLDVYLKLPSDLLRPPYREGFTRAYSWQFLLVGVVNSAYLLVFLANVVQLTRAVLISLVFLAVHPAIYLAMSRGREKKEIPKRGEG